MFPQTIENEKKKKTSSTKALFEKGTIGQTKTVPFKEK